MHGPSGHGPQQCEWKRDVPVTEVEGVRQVGHFSFDKAFSWKRKGKGVAARQGLEEAQRKRTGRRTGTGYKVWYAPDEGARDLEVRYLLLGACFINPASTCGKLRRLLLETCRTVRKHWAPGNRRRTAGRSQQKA